MSKIIIAFNTKAIIHQHNYTQNPTDVSQLRELSTAADVVYLSQKLRLVCLLAAHQSVYQADVENAWEIDLMAMAELTYFRSITRVFRRSKSI